jgi:hypothetical protein
MTTLLSFLVHHQLKILANAMSAWNYYLMKDTVYTPVPSKIFVTWGVVGGTNAHRERTSKRDYY